VVGVPNHAKRGAQNYREEPDENQREGEGAH
jgi:hypothetical protein